MVMGAWVNFCIKDKNSSSFNFTSEREQKITNVVKQICIHNFQVASIRRKMKAKQKFLSN